MSSKASLPSAAVATTSNSGANSERTLCKNSESSSATTKRGCMQYAPREKRGSNQSSRMAQGGGGVVAQSQRGICARAIRIYGGAAGGKSSVGNGERFTLGDKQAFSRADQDLAAALGQGAAAMPFAEQAAGRERRDARGAGQLLIRNGDFETARDAPADRAGQVDQRMRQPIA